MVRVVDKERGSGEYGTSGPFDINSILITGLILFRREAALGVGNMSRYMVLYISMKLDKLGELPYIDKDAFLVYFGKRCPIKEYTEEQNLDFTATQLREEHLLLPGLFLIVAKWPGT